MTEAVVTFETSIPEEVYAALRAHGMVREKLAEQSRQLLALEFFEKRVLSLGQAARLAGMSRWDFIDFLSINGTPVIDLDQEELDREFASFQTLSQRLDEQK